MCTKSRKYIIYTGNFLFPEGCPGSFRVLGIGKALRAAGYDVVFAGANPDCRVEDRDLDGYFRYQGFRYEAIESSLPRLRRVWQHYCTFQRIESMLNALGTENIAAIITYHYPAFASLRLKAYCDRVRIALIADCTEWYDPSHVRGGVFSILSLDSALRMYWAQKRIGAIIPISSYLERYYQAHGCRTVRVPPLIDLTEAKWPSVPAAPASETVRLIYAGSPGKKDLLPRLLQACQRYLREGGRFHLDVVGVSRAQLAQLLAPGDALMDELGACVTIHGRLSHLATLQMVAQADFSLLLRWNQRYAQAGFPTKLVESLGCGVPIITNPTSDIAEYIQDGEQGFLLENESVDAVVSGLRRACALSMTARAAMHVQARERAAQAFDYRQYRGALAQFLKDAMTRCQQQKGKA